MYNLESSCDYHSISPLQAIICSVLVDFFMFSILPQYVMYFSIVVTQSIISTLSLDHPGI